MSKNSSRRTFLKATAAGPVAASAGYAKAKPAQSNIYAKVGVKPLINGIGTVTVWGGSIMPPEVVQAMVDASKHFVNVPELQKKVGERLAQLIGVPGAMVTAGAASSITVATAACITRGDARNRSMIPDTTGMKYEIVQQKSHRCGYEAQMLLTGAKIVWVETREQMEAAINDRTAMMFFLNLADPRGQIKREEFVKIGKARGVPTFMDAAADVPPASHLSDYVKMGFDLVAFSGGKGLLGPQASGLLLGNKEMIEWGMPCISPHGGIGRGMKVGKEEIMGLLAAVERYLKVDHDAEYRLLESKINYIMGVLAKVPGVKTEQFVPEIANHLPHMRVDWDPAQRKVTGEQVSKQLLEGDPAIMLPATQNGVTISVWMMRGDEHRLVAARLRDILAKA